jgi:hypothetical protein
MEIMRNNVRTFVEQQQFSFETLWNKTVPSEQMKKEFLVVAAHELQTPIQPIINIVDILLSDLKNNTNCILNPNFLILQKDVQKD